MKRRIIYRTYDDWKLDTPPEYEEDEDEQEHEERAEYEYQDREEN